MDTGQVRTGPGAARPVLERLEARLLLSGQPVITEFMAVNDSVLADEDGEYSDWIEIHNPTDSDIQLNEWFLTDNLGWATKWQFPSRILRSGEYLVVFASGDSRKTGNELHADFKLSGGGEDLALTHLDGTPGTRFDPYPPQHGDISYGYPVEALGETTLVDEQTPLKAIVPADGDLGLTWTGGSPLDDSDWIDGVSGVGFDEKGAYPGLIRTDLGEQMYFKQTSLYVRYAFEVADPAAFELLLLSMRYDDGFVAYLNGVEIAARNAPGEPAFDSVAVSEHEDSDARQFEKIDVSAFADELRAGTNILAVHGMNLSNDSRDALFAAKLVAAEGTLRAGSASYMAIPTPDGPNNELLWSVVDLGFSKMHGHYGAPFDLELTSVTEGAEIYYTLDGSQPSPIGGMPYTGPIGIDATTTVRAVAVSAGHPPSDVKTRTYIFLDDTLVQTGAGLPFTWGHVGPDYEMDSQVVTDPLYRNKIRDDLMVIPTVSLVMDPGDLFGAGTGLYANPAMRGEAWQRAVSAELITPLAGTGFQINAAVEILDDIASDSPWRMDKLSFRLTFKGAYGPTKLEYPLFGDEAADRFDTLVLDAQDSDTWASHIYSNRQTALYVRGQYLSDLQNAMGGCAPHGRYVHLYLNGLYWGLYCLRERPSGSFAEAYLGATKDDYEVVDGSTAGASQAYNRMISISYGNLADPAQYELLGQLLDVGGFVDYVIANIYVGNLDWGTPNWTATMAADDPSGRWRFHCCNGERILRSVGENITVRWDAIGPAGLHQRLSANADYRMLFADRVYRHFYNDGALTPTRAAARFADRLAEIDRAIVGESARWGDNRRAAPYTRDGEWLAQSGWLTGAYFPPRTGIVLSQLAARGLHASLPTPVFRVNGQGQHGGEVHVGDALTIEAPGSVIYYTLDGSDPRLPGGGISGAAVPYTGPVVLESTSRVKARALSGSRWSAVNEAVYYVDVSPHLRVTEIMYHPSEPTPQEVAAGFTRNRDFEFVELKNIHDRPIRLDGVRFTNGIAFTFPAVELASGQHVVVVADEDAFRMRYGSGVALIAGEFSGSLRNSRERIEVETPLGSPVHNFRYRPEAYPHTNDGSFSLTVRDPLADEAVWDDAAGWRSSVWPGGTPGAEEVALSPGSVIISEALAHTDVAPGDWIELHNTTGGDVDVGGWFLSDDGDELMKYEIAAGTVIPAGGYLVLTQDDHFGRGSSDPGSRDGFGLSELGDDVYLSGAVAGQLTGYREQRHFDASPKELSFAAYPAGTGDGEFALVGEPTPGAPNAETVVGPLIINEVMYHPAGPAPGGPFEDDDYEYVELLNTSDETIDLTQYYLSSGIGFTFGWYELRRGGSTLWTRQGGATARWQAELPTPGEYEILAFVNGTDGRGGLYSLESEARYDVTDAGGVQTVMVNQNDNPTGWLAIGTFALGAGPVSVTLTREAGRPGQRTVADRILFVKGEVKINVGTADAGFIATGTDVTTIGPGEHVVVVRNPAAFEQRYGGAANGIKLAGQYSGGLANRREAVNLRRRDIPEPAGYLPYVLVDRLEYDDDPPWPTEADGTGPSLSRMQRTAYGNDVANWAVGLDGGTPGAVNADVDWIAPTAEIVEVVPNPRPGAVDQIEITFSESVTGVNLSDLALSLDGGVDLLTAAQTLSSDNGVTWTLGNLSGLAERRGAYTLTLTAAGSGIVDVGGNALADDAAETWIVDRPPPSVEALVRNGGGDWPSELWSIAFVFSLDVGASLDVGDLALRDKTRGVDVDLSAAAFHYYEPVRTGFWDLTSVPIDYGYYSVTLDAAGVADAEGMHLDGDSDGAPGGDYGVELLAALPGDADLSGDVGWTDYVAARDRFGQAGAGWAGGDCNYDGYVNWRDYLTLKMNFGRTVAPPPHVLDVERNGGADRPSELTSIAVGFSQDVSASLETSDLTIRDPVTGGKVDLSAAALAYDDRTHTAYWDLGGVRFEPGYYTVKLHAAGVSNAAGLLLDGDADGEGGGDYSLVLLLALPGDADLSGDVGWQDYAAVRDDFGTTGAGWSGGDFNYDGVVDRLDYLALKRNHGRSVPGPLGAGPSLLV